MAKKQQRPRAPVEPREPVARTEAPRDRSLPLLAAILALTVLAYLPVFDAGFVNLDDDYYVTRNELIKSLGNAGQILTQPVQGNYHPLTMLSLALNYAVSGESAWSYHVLNLLLHLVNTVLVFRLAARLSAQDSLVPLTTALLFAVHPMHVESVAWVSERKDVLYACFFLLGLLAYDRFVESKTKALYLQSLLWCALSLASKPAAVVFPLVLIAWDFFRKRAFSPRMLAEKAPFFLLALVAGWLTLQAQTGQGATDTAQLHGLGTRVLFGCYGFALYLVKLVAPVGLSAFYPMPAVGEPLSAAYQLAPLVFVAVLAVSVLTIRKHPVVAGCFAFTLVNLLLVLQFKIVGSAIIADRYTYVPYLGPFFLCGWLLERHLGERRNLALSCLFAVGAVLAVLAHQHARTWHSGATLWDNAIANAPSAHAYMGRAKAYRAEGNPREALRCYDEALKLRESAELYAGRAGARAELGDEALAMEDYAKALTIDPQAASALAGRGALSAKLSRFEEAIADLSAALRLDPGNRAAYRNRGLSYSRRNEFEKAIADYERYLQFVPSDAEVHNGIGVCRQKLQQFERSLGDFDRAIRWKAAPAYFLNRSYSWSALGKPEAAKQDALQARQLGAQVPADYARALGLP
jgi:tetratricopeptide (TPR) repeat protein